ncbi:MAG: hypothetical protein Q7R97_05360 [Candidatus Daviesbacteria bacterium]|nr:hypothetical protein [Candidatus Daviesbacteria bacterium]
MVFLLYLIYLGQQEFVGAGGQLSPEATSAFYQIITHYLQQSAIGMLILGLALALGANYLPKKFHIQ